MKTHIVLPRSAVLLGALLLGLAPFVAGATTYYVKPASEGGSDSAAGTSWDTAFATPKKGFDLVNNKNTAGLELVIAPGTYQLADAIGCTGGYGESHRVVVRGETDNPADVVLRSPGDREVLRLAADITIANLTLENGSNNGAKEFSGVRIGTGGSEGRLSVVSNCVIRGCRNTYAASSGKPQGAAAYVQRDGLLVDCVVSNNTALYLGSAVALVGADAKTLRCLVTGNAATNAAASGAAVIGISGGNLVDCTVSGNKGSVYAGALNVANVSGCLFEGNAAMTEGGGTGGGIGITANSVDASVSNCVFRGNTALSGAGAYIANNAAKFVDCLFENNVASLSGGGVRVTGAANATFDNCRFLDNATTAGIDDNHGGGGLFLQGQTDDGWCAVSNCVFSGNASARRGGAIGATWNGTVFGAIGNCVFTNNSAALQGGGICIREGKTNTHGDKVLTIRNSLIANNRTTGASGDRAGGGLYLVTPNPIEVSNCTIANNVTAQAAGGGIYQRWGGRFVNCILSGNTVNGGSGQEPTSGTICTDADGTFLSCCVHPTMTAHFTEANGCVNADPRFTDAANGDFTLAAARPCTNAGRKLDWMDGAFDLSGIVPRIFGDVPDMGCYERIYQSGTVVFFR